MPAEILQVAATSTYNEWTLGAGSDKVVAVNQPDDDGTTYIGAETVNKRQQYTLQDTTIGDGTETPTITINSVTLTTRAGTTPSWASTGGSYKLQLRISGAAVTAYNTKTIPNNNPFETYSDTFTVKTGGAAWTLANLDDIEVYIESLTDVPVITTVYVTVDYTITFTPDAPSALTIADIDSDHIDLVWSDNSSVEDNQEIQRSLDGDIWETLVILDADVEAYTDDTVHSVTQYYYRIRATNADHESDWSAEVDDTTPAYSGPALTPTALVALNVTPTEIPLTWLENDATDSFELQRSADAGATWATLASLSVEIPFFLFDGLLPGASYQFRVRAINTVGTSAWSDVLSVTTPERNFRHFLEQEILQDVAEFLGWTDKVYVGDQLFTVTQTLNFNTNLSFTEMFSDTELLARYQGQTQDWLVLGPKFATSIKLSAPLIADIPAETILIDDFDPDDPEMLAGYRAQIIVGTGGAKLGDTIINVDHKISTDSGATYGADILPYKMGRYYGPSYIDPPYYDEAGIPKGHKGSLLLNKTVVITTTIDYGGDPPRNVQPIYDSIANEALLRLGYSVEGDVPEDEYQQFRDAGREEVWRAVAYATVSYQDTVDTGTLKLLTQVHVMATQQLDAAEATYNARYTPAPIPVVAIPRPRALSYSGAVKVSF